VEDREERLELTRGKEGSFFKRQEIGDFPLTNVNTYMLWEEN